MTFKKFEEIFRGNYPDGEVIAHGKMGGTEKNRKTTVVFEQGGKCYSYYGAYEDVLNKLGIKVISKERFNELLARKEQLIRWHGTDDFFGGIMDNSKEIAEIEVEIKRIEAEYIIA